MHSFETSNNVFYNSQSGLTLFRVLKLQESSRNACLVLVSDLPMKLPSPHEPLWPWEGIDWVQGLWFCHQKQTLCRSSCGFAESWVHSNQATISGYSFFFLVSMEIGAGEVFSLLILSAFWVQLQAKIAPCNYGSNVFLYLHSILITELFWQIHQVCVKKPQKNAHQKKQPCITKPLHKNKTQIPKQLLHFFWQQLLRLLEKTEK